MDGTIGASKETQQESMSLSLLQELVDLHSGDVQKLQTDPGECNPEVVNGGRQDMADALYVQDSEVTGTAIPADACDTPALARMDVGSPSQTHPISDAVNEQVLDQQAGCRTEKPHEPAEAAATNSVELITPSRGGEGVQPFMEALSPSQPGQDGTEQDNASNACVPAEAAKSGSETASTELSQPDLKPDLADAFDAEPSADPNEAHVPAAGSVSLRVVQQDAAVASGSEAFQATAGLAEGGLGHEQTTNDLPTVLSSPGGAVESSAYSATRAILNKLIAAGASSARSLAEMAGRAGASHGFRAAAATSNAIRAAHPDRFWTDLECIRLTICSDETLPIYLKHRSIKLHSQCFGHSDEIMTSGRTALVLYNVDSKQVIGVWAAIAKDNEFITWQILKNLPGMPSQAFQESPAGAVFPELPPTDTSVRARGDAARTVLRVLFEYAGSIVDGFSSAGVPGNIEVLGHTPASAGEVLDQPALAAEVVGSPSDEVTLLAGQQEATAQEATDTAADEAPVGLEAEGGSTVAVVQSQAQVAQEDDLALEAGTPAAQVADEVRAAVAQMVDTGIQTVETAVAVGPEADVDEPETDATAIREVQAAAAEELEAAAEWEEAVRKAAAAWDAAAEWEENLAAEWEAKAARREAEVAREAEGTAARDAEVQEQGALEAEVEMPAAEGESLEAVIGSPSPSTANNDVTLVSEATWASAIDATVPPTDIVATAASESGTVAPAPLVVTAHSPSPVANGPAVFPYHPVVPLVRVLSAQLRAASPTTAAAAPAAVSSVPVVAVPVAGTEAAAPVVQAAPIVVAATVMGGGPRPVAAPAAGGAAPRPYMPPFFFLQQQRMAAAAAAAAQPQPAVVAAPTQPGPPTQAQEVEPESQTAAQPSTTEPQRAVPQSLPSFEPAAAQPPLQTQPAAPQATQQTPHTTTQPTEEVHRPAQLQRNPSAPQTHRAPQPTRAARQPRNVPAATGTLAPVPMQLVGQQPKPVVVRQGRGPAPVRVSAQPTPPVPVTSAAQSAAPTGLGASVTAPVPAVSTGPSASSEAPTPVPGPVAPPAAQGTVRPLNFLAAAARSSVRPLMAGPNQQIPRPLQAPPAGVPVSNWPAMQGAPSYGVRPPNPVAGAISFAPAAVAQPMVQPWAALHAVTLPPAPAAEAPNESSAARLICPLCQQRTGCWFLLSCSHMGPCEECCASVDQVKEAYPNCARCGKAVGDKIMKARVS